MRLDSLVSHVHTGPWPRLLEVDHPLHFTVQLEGRGGQARRALGNIQAVERRLRADRAGSTLSTLGTLSSLSASASLTDKLNSSQYSLGGSCCTCHISLELLQISVGIAQCTR